MFKEEQVRKLQALRDNGIDPYPQFSASNDLNSIKSIITKYESGSMIDGHNYSLNIAGRLRFKNEMGNVGFARIFVEDFKIQVFISKKEVGEDYKVWNSLDLGDLVYISGHLMRTRSGEITLRAQKIKLAAKCLNPMPDKIDGISDPELMQRQRYLDLMVNQETFERFKFRSQFISRLRSYMNEHDFLEVETPILTPISGGAAAKPFITHHNNLGLDLYLRIAPELYLKRLIVGGFSKVFEIGKNFRNESCDKSHNSEFTTIEFYMANTNCYQMMEFVKNLFSNCIKRDKIIFGDLEIDMTAWSEIKYLDAIKAQGVEDPWDIESVRNFMQGAGYQDIPNNLSKMLDIIFSDYIEPKIINPTFITHYPVDISPLAKRNADDNRLTDRFELFIAGREMANAFSELNDPVDQAERFAEQVAKKDAGDDEAMHFDADYINALSYGMVSASGCGIGIDRLVMLLTNSSNIRDVILFPILKSQNKM